MNVLSLFDGIAGARIALDKINAPVERYYASEIDSWAIKVALHNYPDIVELGDVFTVSKNTFVHDIDLLIGGSPCTSLSKAKHQKESGLEVGESTLFWEYLRVLREIKPKYFLLENVGTMKKMDCDRISEVLGVEPLRINSARFSAQERDRLYWTNIPVDLSKLPDSDAIIEDILDFSVPITRNYLVEYNAKYYTIDPREKFKKKVRIGQYNKGNQGERVYSIKGKFPTLVKSHRTEIVLIPDQGYRTLKPHECERLQTIPEGYTAIAPPTPRHRLIGLGFTIDVISFILSFIPELW